MVHSVGSRNHPGLMPLIRSCLMATTQEVESNETEKVSSLRGTDVHIEK